jgi:methylmalonyl-CoA epimerase
VEAQRVRAQFVHTGAASLELLQATSPDSAIARFLQKRGPGLHHITLRVEDIAGALELLKSRGARLIDERPRPGAEGRNRYVPKRRRNDGFVLAHGAVADERWEKGEIRFVAAYNSIFNLIFIFKGYE